MKVIGLVSECRECPNRTYYSGGRYSCAKANALLPYDDGVAIPEWCPLADYPASAMSRLQDDNAELRRRIAALDKPRGGTREIGG